MGPLMLSLFCEEIGGVEMESEVLCVFVPMSGWRISFINVRIMASNVLLIL